MSVEGLERFATPHMVGERSVTSARSGVCSSVIKILYNVTRGA
jgi:hypothetical protein